MNSRMESTGESPWCASSETSLRVSATDTAPIPITIADAGTSKTASGHSSGRSTATASTASRSTAETDSAMAALNFQLPPRPKR